MRARMDTGYERCESCGEALPVDAMAREVQEDGATGTLCPPCDEHAKASAGRVLLPIDDPFSETPPRTCRSARCTRQATVEIFRDWWVCEKCAHLMSA